MANFVNFSNHSSSSWSKEQTAAALEIPKNEGGGEGKIVDLQFPTIDPHATNDDLRALAAEYIDKVAELEPAAVMIQGEFTFTWTFIKMLYAITAVPCYAACSERKVTETVNPDGTTEKKSRFEFVQFRKYEIPY